MSWKVTHEDVEYRTLEASRNLVRTFTVCDYIQQVPLREGRKERRNLSFTKLNLLQSIKFFKINKSNAHANSQTHVLPLS
jgi:hypothetical protein